MSNRIPENILKYIADESERIHHGRIVIEVNADKPGRFDVVSERRERFVDVVDGSGGPGGR